MKKSLLIFFVLLTTHCWSAPGDSLSVASEDVKPLKREVSYHHKMVSKYSKVMSRDLNLPSLPTYQEDVTFHEIRVLGDTLQGEQLEAFEMDAYVKENKRFVETFDENVILDLPVGIKKTIGNLTYTIVVSELQMKPEGAYLSASMVFEVPDSEKKIAFGARNIRFSKRGGLASGAQLRLLGKQDVKLGPNTTLSLLAEKTFIEWDCDGFKAMGIDAAVEFSRDLFIPDSTSKTPSDRVTGRFTTVITDWNDMIAEITIPPFQVKGLKDFVFTVKKAVIDNSTLRALPGMNYPENYESAMSGGLWKGISIQELSLKLPSAFNKGNGKEPVKISLYNTVIDKQGITTTAQFSNLIGDGKMDKWPFSVESFRLSIVSNKLVGAGFAGQVKLPVLKDKPLDYTAVIAQNDQYTFSISAPEEGIEFDFLSAAEVEIYSSSYVEVQLKDGKFLPKASLNGKMSIGVGKELNVPDLGFEGLNIQTVEPYISIQGFSLSDIKGPSLGAFSMGISDISGSVSKEKINLAFTAYVSIVGDDGGNFGGEAGFTISSKYDRGTEDESAENYQSPKWVFDGVSIHKIGINIDNGAYSLAGSLTWFKDDDVYGNGFYGEVQMGVLEGMLNVQAVGLFGSVHNYRYWFADALAHLSNATIGAAKINAFGGGASYHLKPSTDGVSSPFARSLSGVNYVPDSTAGMAIKAMITLSTTDGGLFNGDAALTVAFNEGGGLREVDFKGNGYFLTPVVTISIPGLSGMVDNMVNNVANSLMPKAAISAHIHINYDVVNKTLHGNFETFINIAYGVIKGIGQDNRAGWAVLHISPDDWYIHVGSPTDPVGLQILGLVKTESYFMMGDYIPGSPPPPKLVQEVLDLGEDMMTYMDDLNAVGEGKGIAFGTRFGMDTGDQSFLMFYGRFAATAGFDVMLKDYGSTTCVGSTEPIGINGWYANGQAFAAFMGKIGIKVRLFGKKRKLEILKIAAGAILQAKLPNPLWMKGVVGGEFSVLNGLVSGHCRFEVTIGDDCELQTGSVLENLNVISQLTPADNEGDVNVFTAAQGIFDMEVEKEFQMVDLDEKRKVFRIKLDEMKLYDGTQELRGTMTWNDLHDVVSLKTTEILPGEKQLKLVVQVSFEENVNNTWVPVTVNGEKVIERKEAQFTTGEEPDYLPEDNVAYSYPTNKQLHFHPGEHGSGYVHLISGMSKLFDPGKEWNQIGRFVSSTGEEVEFDFTYSNNEISFNIPDELNTNTIYKLEIVNLPLNTSDGIDSNVAQGNKAVTQDIGESTMEVKTKTASGTIQQYQEKIVYSAVFQTSNYNTFKEKVAALNIYNTWRVPVRPTIHQLKAAVEGQETFDTYEIKGGSNYLPLVSFTAELNIPWFKNMIEPLAYPSPFPISGITLSEDRMSMPYGVPPYKALYITQQDEDLYLDADMAASGTVINTPGNSTIIYNLPLIMYQDYSHVRQQATQNISMGQGNDWMERVMETPFPGIQTGTTYKVNIEYRLPGINTVTSYETISFQIN
ncbi:hypothetical protein LVD15_04190 [Fulvivirga maritima]|uniref:hypothetical protein n=1 Tax=Fulvivirga maritima TaxID=2904247 RepID=UPI001F3909BE|nr:hypothetical protein [Fulvivirga maritima]UII27634.1 hypothetical protein LVD15_04190 [Fulvivirga maritima]